MSPKIGDLELSWISRRDRVGFPKCLDLHMHCCATVSASNFQVLICSGWRASTLGSFIRFLAGPARTSRYYFCNSYERCFCVCVCAYYVCVPSSTHVHEEQIPTRTSSEFQKHPRSTYSSGPTATAAVQHKWISQPSFTQERLCSSFSTPPGFGVNHIPKGTCTVSYIVS